jgi:hypothetical protein
MVFSKWFGMYCCGTGIAVRIVLVKILKNRDGLRPSFIIKKTHASADAQVSFGE